MFAKCLKLCHSKKKEGSNIFLVFIAFKEHLISSDVAADQGCQVGIFNAKFLKFGLF